MNATPFVKMHGLGNDFVVLDDRDGSLAIDRVRAAAIADRRRGVGCDQVLILKPANDPGADVFMEIRNVDGTEAEACGNGTRCVASLIMDEKGADALDVETVVGIRPVTRDANGHVSVDMGPPGINWAEIPLAHEADTLHIEFENAPLSDGVGVNMGNPHVVFFIDDAETVELENIGPPMEHHSLLPMRANIELVSQLGSNKLRVRVWERSSGITQACGSGACAVGVAANRRGLTGRKVEVVLDGGSLFTEWRENDGHVLMAGPAATSFRGQLDPSLLAR